MAGRSWSSVEVRFLDRDKVFEALRRAAAQAKAVHPEIAKVLLFGSLARGNWTADSDADLLVVVRRGFDGLDLRERGRYWISTPAISTDSLVYSEQEFEQLSHDPSSFVAQALREAVEL